MNTKLTLSLNKEIIERAKLYAKEHNISLSFLIENYLQKILSEYQSEEIAKGSIVNELSGIIDLSKESGITDYRKDHTDYLQEKYK